MSVRNRLRRLGRGWRATPLFAIAMLVGVAVVGWGCTPVDIHPAVGSTTPLGTYMRPAKAPDCAMPVLETTPNTGFQQVAIVDAWGDLAAKDSELIPILKRRACEAGADAVVITTNSSQREGKKLAGAGPGRYGNIGPGSEDSEGGPKHHPVIGEVGHAGRYISGVAIVYSKDQEGQNAAASTGQ